MTENRQLQQAENDVHARARLRQCGGPREFCVAPLLTLPPGVLATAIENVVVRGVRRLVDTGWRPVDIGEMRARRLDAVVAVCLFDALALVTATDARWRSDPVWTAELDAVAPDRWQVPTRSVLAQRAAAEGWSPAMFAGVALDLLADIADWPALAAATPLETRGGDGETAMLIKVRALLAKAERTEFEHEAEAFTAKAQQLMARHSIDDAMIGHGASTTAGAALQRMWIATPYVNAKAAIIAAVARANRCTALLAQGVGCVSIVGMGTDVRSTVLLATSLQLQAARAAARARPDDSDGWSAGVRSFRRSFLLAFASRIGERLREAGVDAVREVDPDRLLPVLADRQEIVDRAVAEWFPRTRQLRTGTVDPSGWAAGTAAADLAQLDAHPPLQGTA